MDVLQKRISGQIYKNDTKKAKLLRATTFDITIIEDQ